ncbi:hypothetical protein MNV49_006072 [Pseudohyphozyma bogoriensis]|nr:hypothetical protein MNV49_006072 [Pseudohyphozyma bogoriensis]
MVEFEKRVRANLKALPPAPAPAVPSSPSLPVDFSVLSRRTSTHASASTSRPPPLASSAAPPMPTPAGLHNSPTILHPTAPYAAAAAAAAWPIFTPLEQPLSHSPVSIDFSATYPSFAAAPESPDSLLSYESSHWASSSSSDTDQLLFTPPPPLYEPYEELPEHFTHAEGAKETLALPLFFPLPPKSFGQDPPYGSDVLFGLDDWTFGGDLMSY